MLAGIQFIPASAKTLDFAYSGAVFLVLIVFLIISYHYTYAVEEADD